MQWNWSVVTGIMYLLHLYLSSCRWKDTDDVSTIKTRKICHTKQLSQNPILLVLTILIDSYASLPKQKSPGSKIFVPNQCSMFVVYCISFQLKVWLPRNKTFYSLPDSFRGDLTCSLAWNPTLWLRSSRVGVRGNKRLEQLEQWGKWGGSLGILRGWITSSRGRAKMSEEGPRNILLHYSLTSSTAPEGLSW